MARKKSGRRDNKSGQIVKDGKYFRARLEVSRDARTGKAVYATARCQSRDEAVDALNKMITDHGLGVTQPTERSNFGEFLDQWLTTIKATRSANTYRQYEFLVRLHIKPHLGTKQANAITRAEVQRLLSAKAGQTLTPRDKEGKNASEQTLSSNTLRLIRACLHSAFEEAKSQGITRKNPADDVDLPRRTKDAKKQFLTPEETAKFMKALDTSDLADLFAFMIATGTRLGEACAVRWQDLDLTVSERPLVWIRGQLQRKDGKLAYIAGTKTNQERCLPLSKPVADRIKAISDCQFDRLMKQMAEHPEVDFRFVTHQPDDMVFLNAEGRLLDQKHVNDRLAELCTKAGVPTISAHKLRHTAATLALAETGDLHGVQKMLGHSQVSLTSDLYGHATAETLRPLSEAIQKAMSR